MWSIQRGGDAAHASPWTTRSYRIRSREESAQASLTLNVRTAEGDTVELSLDATSVRQRTSGSVRTSNGKASYADASQAASVNFKATIKGDLNDQEMADIVSLIHSLGSGESSVTPLSSLAAYSGAFSRTFTAGNSMVRLYA